MLEQCSNPTVRLQFPVCTVHDQVTDDIHAAYQPALADSEPPLSSSSKPAALVALAEQEWQKWGKLRAIAERDNGRYCLQDAEGGCVAEEVMPRGYFIDGKSEVPYSDEQCALITRYWRAVGREFNCDNIHDEGWPWSAAFISWLFYKSGFSPDQFKPYDAHAGYIVDARDQLLAKNVLAAEPVPAVPRVGDLVCAVRGSDTAVTDLAGVVAGKTKSHCDLVVEAALAAQQIEVIGGNVFGVVARTTIQLDKSLQLQRDTNHRRPWITVLRNRQLV